MKKIGMDIELSGHLAYRHPFLGNQLHCISFELTAEMTSLFPHRHLLSSIIQILRCVHQLGGSSTRNLLTIWLTKMKEMEVYTARQKLTAFSGSKVTKSQTRIRG